MRLTSGGRRLSPTRESVLRDIERATDGLTIAEISQHLSLHENTVRMHLTALHRDGFVQRTRDEPQDRGRPAWRWHRLRRKSSAYVSLVAALATQLRAESPNPTESATQAGIAWGRTLAAERNVQHTAGSDTAVALVTEILRAEGFAPNPREHTIELKQCPLIEAAGAHPDIVCAVHLGMVQGALEHLGAKDTGSTLTPLTSPGTCTLQLKIAETS